MARRRSVLDEIRVVNTTPAGQTTSNAVNLVVPG
jgi:hypothetical protein